jgi:hypothetical protein
MMFVLKWWAVRGLNAHEAHKPARGAQARFLGLALSASGGPRLSFKCVKPFSSLT